MDLETLLKTKTFLEDMSVSIRNILRANFPEMSREEKEDIDNEVKMKLWKKAAGGKKIDNLRSYLWRVVYTTALDLIEERMPHLSLEKFIAASEREGRASEKVMSRVSSIEEREHRLMLAGRSTRFRKGGGPSSVFTSREWISLRSLGGSSGGKIRSVICFTGG